MCHWCFWHTMSIQIVNHFIQKEFKSFASHSRDNEAITWIYDEHFLIEKQNSPHALSFAIFFNKSPFDMVLQGNSNWSWVDTHTTIFPFINNCAICSSIIVRDINSAVLVFLFIYKCCHIQPSPLSNLHID